MSLTLSPELLAKTSLKSLASYRAQQAHRREPEILLKSETLTGEDLEHLRAAADSVGDKKALRAIDSIIAGRSGIFDKPIPSFKALQSVLTSYLLKDAIDHWVYRRADDGNFYPELVTGITFQNDPHSRTPPRVMIHTSCYTVQRDRGESLAIEHRGHPINPGDATNRRVADILMNLGLFKESRELRDAYDQAMAEHSAKKDQFGQQFVHSGPLFKDYYGTKHEEDNPKAVRRVIHDTTAGRPYAPHEEVNLGGHAFTGDVPIHPLLKVFDLGSHKGFWCNSANLRPYKYDKGLRDKLVLPDTHQHALDILTTYLGSFTSDIIEGKAAGNIILCKGLPGVGKTLTAEVYAELMERPLLKVHSGELGVTPQDVQAGLELIFERHRRWNCVILIDEVDVFVARRGTSIEKNAIVSEFLRAVEYFDGLMFLTSNRPDDIDEAFLQRCAVILDYPVPDKSALRRIWKIMGDQFDVDISDSLLDDLVDRFPGILPRDIKMLIPPVRREMASRKTPLSIDLFVTWATLRAIKIADPKKTHLPPYQTT